jgi:hypothetical protein
VPPSPFTNAGTFDPLERQVAEDGLGHLGDDLVAGLTFSRRRQVRRIPTPNSISSAPISNVGSAKGVRRGERDAEAAAVVVHLASDGAASVSEPPASAFAPAIFSASTVTRLLGDPPCRAVRHGDVVIRQTDRP